MEKQKSTIYLEERLLKQVDECVALYGYKSKNEFYVRAVENQIVSDKLGEDGGLVVEKLAKAFEKQSKTLSKTIARALFRYAVDIEMMMHIQTALVDVTTEDIKRLRGRAIRDVKKLSGVISLEDIADFQKAGRTAERIEGVWDE